MTSLKSWGMQSKKVYFPTCIHPGKKHSAHFVSHKNNKRKKKLLHITIPTHTLYVQEIPYYIFFSRREKKKKTQYFSSISCISSLYTEEFFTSSLEEGRRRRRGSYGFRVYIQPFLCF